MKTNKTILAFSAIAFVFLISGCASKSGDVAKEQKTMAKQQMEIDKERQKMAQEKAEKSLDAMPDWALSVPQPDATGMYAVGMGDSDKVPVAIKKARLQAQYELAAMYNAELAGGERSSTQDSGHTSSTQYTALIEKLVDYVPVVGFQVVKQDVKPIDGRFHAFVLLKLPYEDFNAVLQEQKKKATTVQDKTQFEDLERRLEQRRQAKAR